MNLTILLPAIGKIVGQTLFFRRQPTSENSKFKPIKLRLKIDIALHPARVEGFINAHIPLRG